MVKSLWAILVSGFIALSAWSQEVSPPSILAHRSELTRTSSANQSAPQTLTIPADTEVAVEMLSGIHTQINRVNDPITARLRQPVYINGRVALPPGSLLDGHITVIRSAGRMRRPAELGLRFERITLPDGQAEPIAAVLAGMDKPETLQVRLDAEGHLKGTRAFSWKSLFGGFVGLGTFGTVRAALAGPATASALLPLSGAVVFGYEILWPRGRDVNLPPETPCRLRLNHPLTVRVPW